MCGCFVGESLIQLIVRRNPCIYSLVSVFVEHGSPNLYGEGPHPYLGAGSRADIGKNNDWYT